MAAGDFEYVVIRGFRAELFSSPHKSRLAGDGRVHRILGGTVHRNVRHPIDRYLLGSWLGSRFPLLRDTHAGGHLWNDLIGWTGDPI